MNDRISFAIRILHVNISIKLVLFQTGPQQKTLAYFARVITTALSWKIRKFITSGNVAGKATSTDDNDQSC